MILENTLNNKFVLSVKNVLDGKTSVILII